MELQRQDYPGMLEKLQPVQAVNLLNDRLKYINRLNTDVAEWLQERRRIEETYAASLRKLAGRGFKDSDVTDLGIFQIPWQKMVASTEGLAKAHHGLAQNIGNEVEMPLRDWAAKDRDAQQMSNIIGNIQAIARDLETAQKKSEKLGSKGGKADAGKVATAAFGVESALTQWESQAPYVFERLQAVDEARVDNMRNVLTQYQTFVIEAGSSLSESSEDSLNALLNVQTVDEIKTFVMKSTKVLPQSQRRMSMRQDASVLPMTDAGSSLTPVPSLPRDDLSSHRSNSFQEQPERSAKPELKSEKSADKSKLSGLKRFGTVLGRRRQSTNPYAASRSPERKKSSADVRSSPFGRFGRKESSHQPLETVPSPQGTAYANVNETPSSRGQDGPPQLESVASITSHGINGTNLETVNEREYAPPSLAIGTQNQSGIFQESLQPSPNFEPPKDEHGFTIPPPNRANPDAMQQALAEAADTNEVNQPQFKIDIKNAPVQEESGDTSAAFAMFGNALQNTAPRRSGGTIRNRRDRNTIMIPSAQSIPEFPRDPLLVEPPGSAPLPAESSSRTAVQSVIPVIVPAGQPAAETIAPVDIAPSLSEPSNDDDVPLSVLAAAAALAPEVTLPTSDATNEPTNEPAKELTVARERVTPALDTATSPLLAPIGSPLSQHSPFKTSSRTALGLDDYAGSDTHSIRSGRSLGSIVSATVKHPDMHGEGINSSIVETVSASFADGKVVRSNLVGEVGLSFNPTDLNGPFGTETIRLDNLGPGDKLAPNPAFVDTVPGRPGLFSVNLGQITKTQVAFKYQIHVTAENTSTQVPLLLSTQWRVDAKQADCRLHYTINPEYPAESLTFSDLILVIHMEVPGGTRLLSCRASNGFKFRKESGIIYWKLGDITLSKGSPPKPLLARVVTEGEIKPGTTEARWEIHGSIGSSVLLSTLEETKGKERDVEDEEDPFADEDESGSHKDKEQWREVTAIKKWRAGNYVVL